MSFTQVVLSGLAMAAAALSLGAHAAETPLATTLAGIEAGAWQDVTSTFTFPALGSGTHAFTIAAEYTNWAASQTFAVNDMLAFAGSDAAGATYTTSDAITSVTFDSNSGASQWAGYIGSTLQASANSLLQVWQSASGAHYAFAYEDWKLGTHDFNDFVVTTSVSAVPEPGTLSLLLAGLGIAGATARRRRSS